MYRRRVATARPAQPVIVEPVLISGYRERRYAWFCREEGLRLRAFSVKNGRSVVAGEAVDGEIDVGIGFHLGRADAPAVFAQLFGFTSGQFEAVKTGLRVLTVPQVRQLFEYCVQETEDFLDARLAGVSLDECERLALVSMAYASGGSLIGPKITAALKAGNRSAALAEILWNSHANRAPTYRPEMDRGVFGRRYREAQLFASVSAVAAEVPPYAEYMARHLRGRER